jgi:hypothetical protein
MAYSYPEVIVPNTHASTTPLSRSVARNVGVRLSGMAASYATILMRPAIRDVGTMTVSRLFQALIEQVGPNGVALE